MITGRTLITPSMRFLLALWPPPFSSPCSFMAIFEKLLRTTSPALSPSAAPRRRSDIEAQNHMGGFSAKLGYPSPKTTVNAREVSVVMPGDNVPTFIAHPAPVPCPPERLRWPSHQQPPDLRALPSFS
ncbi:UNVERIFIED_CONTAM: hypothetical protein Slati_4050100 [Sesamum latifolium]|uniref:Uncharacterized protein n=1 Tax=Sesamum latifolium TaxID=2727402 RepID=A0AAW2TT06_9LAMI